MDAVFQALAHRDRRAILDLLKDAPGSTVGEVSSCFDSSRIAVMKHIGVLESAGLVTSEPDGRKRRLYFNPVPIQMIHDRWSSDYSRLWAGRLTSIKYKVEAAAEEQAAKQAKRSPRKRTKKAGKSPGKRGGKRS